MSNYATKLIKDNKGFITFIILMSVFRSSLADWNTVPTGSMKPTIIEGDRIVINKLAYDFKLPFSNISIAKLGEPERGDIIVFNSAVSEKRLVKRVIGLPGDTVSMNNNVLTINGTELAYTENTSQASNASMQYSKDLTENLLGAEHQVRLSNTPSRAANFSTITVPKDMYLALGDNRDNSIDSRYIGFIPRNELIGRSSAVAMSFDYDNNYLLRKDRFFKSLP